MLTEKEKESSQLKEKFNEAKNFPQCLSSDKDTIIPTPTPKITCK